MNEQFERTGLLVGEEAINKLQNSRVAVFGIGGVGGYVCEALVRSGVGHFDLIDKDTVSASNLNRQIIASYDTVGESKTEVMRRRMLSINPEADIRVYNSFFLPENSSSFPFEEFDYTVDAVDTVTAKIELILCSQRAGVPVISSMGTGNKLDPSRLRVSDIYSTSVCPLARVMRRELRKRGVKALKVVWSDEEPTLPEKRISSVQDDSAENTVRKDVPGSTAFVPGAAGLLIASAVIRDLIKKQE